MSIFSNLTNEGLEESQDRLGGYSPLDTDIYLATIKMAYGGQSTGGAKSVTVVADVETPSGTKEYRETVYITKKSGENFFMQNDKKVPLPGFTTIDELCLVTTNNPLAAQGHEDKVVNIYDSESQSEKPTSVPMLMDLLGKQVYLAIEQATENKREKQGNDYVPTANTRQTNSIQKVFNHPTKLTVPEARQGISEPVFFDSWLQKNKGTVRDRTDKNLGSASSGTPGSPPTGGNAAAPKKSLFG